METKDTSKWSLQAQTAYQRFVIAHDISVTEPSIGRLFEVCKALICASKNSVPINALHDSIQIYSSKLHYQAEFFDINSTVVIDPNSRFSFEFGLEARELLEDLSPGVFQGNKQRLDQLRALAKSPILSTIQDKKASAQEDFQKNLNISAWRFYQLYLVACADIEKKDYSGNNYFDLIRYFVLAKRGGTPLHILKLEYSSFVSSCFDAIGLLERVSDTAGELEIRRHLEEIQPGLATDNPQKIKLLQAKVNSNQSLLDLNVWINLDPKNLRLANRHCAVAPIPAPSQIPNPELSWTDEARALYKEFLNAHSVYYQYHQSSNNLQQKELAFFRAANTFASFSRMNPPCSEIKPYYEFYVPTILAYIQEYEQLNCFEMELEARGCLESLCPNLYPKNHTRRAELMKIIRDNDPVKATHMSDQAWAYYQRFLDAKDQSKKCRTLESLLTIYRYLIWTKRSGANHPVIQQVYTIYAELMQDAATTKFIGNHLVSVAHEVCQYVEELAPGKYPNNKVRMRELEKCLQANPQLIQDSVSRVPKPPALTAAKPVPVAPAKPSVLAPRKVQLGSRRSSGSQPADATEQLVTRSLNNGGNRPGVSAPAPTPAPKGWPQEAWNNFQKYKHYYGLMQDRESGYTDMLGVFRYLIWAGRHGAPKEVLQKEYEIIVPLLTRGAEMLEERNNISTAQELRKYIEEIAPGRVKGNTTALLRIDEKLTAEPRLAKENLSNVPRPPVTESITVTGEQKEQHNNKMVKYIVDSIIERLTLKYPNQPERKEYRKYTIETPEQFAKLREKIDWTHGEAREQSFLTNSFLLERKLPDDPIFKACYSAMIEAIMKACFKTQTTFSAVKIIVDVSQFKDDLILDPVNKYFDEFNNRASSHFTGSSTPQLGAASKPQPIPTSTKAQMFKTSSPQPLKKPPTPPESNSPTNQYF